MAEGFQMKSENKFKEIFGTVSGRSIWDNWGSTKSVTSTSATDNKKVASVNDIKSLVGKKGYEGYTEKELIEYYKSQGYEIK